MRKMQSRKLTISLFFVYLLLLSGVVLFKTSLSFTFLHMQFNFVLSDAQRSINLIPFGGMLVLNGRPAYMEIVLNALIFVPFGVFLCMLKKKKSLVSVLAPIALTSLLYEVIQYVFVLGASDITDIIANTLGGMTGALMFHILHGVCKERVYQVVNIVAMGFVIIFLFLASMVKLA